MKKQWPFKGPLLEGQSEREKDKHEYGVTQRVKQMGESMNQINT
jgi:hypothetical protein